MKNSIALPQTIISPIDGAEMVLIPDGEFTMGLEEEELNHIFLLDGFENPVFEIGGETFTRVGCAACHEPAGVSRFLRAAHQRRAGVGAFRRGAHSIGRKGKPPTLKCGCHAN